MMMMMMMMMTTAITMMCSPPGAFSLDPIKVCSRRYPDNCPPPLRTNAPVGLGRLSYLRSGSIDLNDDQGYRLYYCARYCCRWLTNQPNSPMNRTNKQNNDEKKTTTMTFPNFAPPPLASPNHINLDKTLWIVCFCSLHLL